VNSFPESVFEVRFTGIQTVGQARVVTCNDVSNQLAPFLERGAGVLCTRCGMVDFSGLVFVHGLRVSGTQEVLLKRTGGFAEVVPEPCKLAPLRRFQRLEKPGGLVCHLE
jgi:hypothetical protein